MVLECSGDLHKSNAARKDAELQDLRRVVVAKEKSIDSLRTQLATAKGSLEAYTQESEAILQQREGEVNLAFRLERQNSIYCTLITLEAGNYRIWSSPWLRNRVSYK